MSKPLPIHEVFTTFQGEGCYMGRAAFFIRTYGCPLHCSWCDSAGTWHKDFKPPNGVKHHTPQELIEMAKASKTGRVVITGGEPTILDLTELTFGLTLAGIKVHLETSGAFPLRGCFDWITLSPKVAKLPLKENLLRTSELKFICDRPQAIDEWRDELGAILQTDFHKWAERNLNGNVWLHPEWSQRDSQPRLNLISQYVAEFPRVYRAGYQVHKLYKVDALDHRSAPLVPLGGDSSKGY